MRGFKSRTGRWVGEKFKGLRRVAEEADGWLAR